MPLPPLTFNTIEEVKEPEPERERAPGLREETLLEIAKRAKRGDRPYAMEAVSMAEEILELRKRLNVPPMQYGISVGGSLHPSAGRHLIIPPFSGHGFNTLSAPAKAEALTIASQLSGAFDWSASYPGFTFWATVTDILKLELQK